MLEFNYKDEKEKYDIELKSIDTNRIKIIGKIPAKGKGFILSRKGYNDRWDYLEYKTVYKIEENAVIFSKDGSVYVEPEPVPEPEPYVPALEEVIEQKVSEMNMEQQQAIQNGVDVMLTDGTVEHFTLTDHDQTSLMGLQTMVASGAEKIPWHTSDQTEPCKYYSNEDMQLILAAAMGYIAYHVTYFRDLRIYIRSMPTKEEVESVFYGMEIPIEFQSEPLKEMLAANQ